MQIKSYAKINVALDVVGKRTDGYHDLRSIMASVDLHDIITLGALNGNQIIIKSDAEDLPLGENNLAYKAAQIIKDQFDINEGIEISIEKNIPLSAGLAGGSSNAAAVIKGMNEWFKLKMTLSEMIKIGEQIGSDVPYCIYGKAALVEGRGERVQPIRALPEATIILIKPKAIRVSTGDVFRQLSMNHIYHPNIDGLLLSIENGSYTGMINHLGNALEDTTFELYPDVKDLKEQLIRIAGNGVLMSGSGPTMMVFTQSNRLIDLIKATISPVHFDVFATEFIK